jgi:hypothetical protein
MSIAEAQPNLSKAELTQSLASVSILSKNNLA